MCTIIHFDQKLNWFSARETFISHEFFILPQNLPPCIISSGTCTMAPISARHKTPKSGQREPKRLMCLFPANDLRKPLVFQPAQIRIQLCHLSANLILSVCGLATVERLYFTVVLRVYFWGDSWSKFCLFVREQSVITDCHDCQWLSNDCFTSMSCDQSVLFYIITTGQQHKCCAAARHFFAVAYNYD